MNSDARGDTRISIYVNDISEPEVQMLAEAVADILRDHGFGNRESFRSVVAAEAWEWPASDHEAFIEEMKVAGGFFVLPDAGGEN
jgi:hypothetical protein